MHFHLYTVILLIMLCNYSKGIPKPGHKSREQSSVEFDYNYAEGGTGWIGSVVSSERQKMPNRRFSRPADYDTQVLVRYDDCWYGTNYDYKLNECVSYLNPQHH